ncbi:adenosine deaminase [Rothia sp. AR01]|uniref:Adenosine deaminase n=1 Tax=Rothia santali TaxID=2949643 RepID=A0A9X2KH46_9MICC|nr:adenosine deaminase [Rothia santali]MCP3425497.1 adenosine deaminase [Rothia santali]
MKTIDLHIHLPGTVRAATLADLAAANGVELPMPATELYPRINSDPTEEELTRGPWFPLLRVYELISASLRTRGDFARTVYEAMQDGYHQSGTVYSEFAFSPSVHLAAGVEYREMVAGIEEGIEAARKDLGVDARALAAVNREDTPEVALAMVEEVVARPSDAVVGIGLDFDERKGLPATFAEAFQLAGRHGLKRTAHAGEHVPTAQTIPTCLDLLGCDRIDHGYHVLKDADVVKRCADEGVYFNTAFTTSRRALRPWRRESIREMLDAGLKVTINSDDPALFPTTLARELEITVDLLGEDRRREFVANGVEASFLPEAEKAALREAVAREG